MGSGEEGKAVTAPDTSSNSDTATSPPPKPIKDMTLEELAMENVEVRALLIGINKFKEQLSDLRDQHAQLLLDIQQEEKAKPPVPPKRVEDEEYKKVYQ